MSASRVHSVACDSARVSRAKARKGSKPRRDPLGRNILIAGVTFASLAVVSAGMALFGPADDLRSGSGAPAPTAASPGGITVALVDPVPPPVVRRDPRLPIKTPDAARMSFAERFELLMPAQSVTKSVATVPAATAAAAPSRVAVAPMRREPVRIAAIKPDQIKATAPAAPRQRHAASRARPHIVASRTTVALPAIVAPPATTTPSEEAALAFADPSNNPSQDPRTTGSLGAITHGPARLPPKRAAVVRSRPSRPLTPHEKLYGPVQVASLTPAGAMPDAGSALPHAPYDPSTAVYVISEKRVYMPDGSTLEAHSGLGQYLDNPRFANLRMRGVTPPHVYDMKLRESLFHGVEAIRLKPVGGEGAVFHRDGLLAHTYMLGPNGQSNGCVSFKDYGAFLRAFKARKISRLAVIARLN